MKTKSSLLFLLTFFLLSFNAFSKDKNKHLYKRWQAVQIEDAFIDSMKKEQEMYIDTLSILTEEMAAYFKTNDLNEVKEIFKAELEEGKEFNELSIKLTSIEFLKNNTVIFHRYPERDTAHFNLKNEGKEIIFSNTADNESDGFMIEKLDKKTLIISPLEGVHKSTITFRVYDEIKDKNNAEKAFESINEKIMKETEDVWDEIIKQEQE